MTYEQALEKIHSLLTFGSRPGLDRMRELLELMGNPQDRLRYIHVAGTNGKGSVCAMLSSALVAAGYKTGLFISPYITDFRERIQINNEMISQETLVKAVEDTFPLLEKLRAQGTVITEFEYVNALQFYIHANEGCDVVVLETGMGGLLDCTNVIKAPICSVITTIGLDHTAVLGDTIEKIAVQKCGILKKGSIAVTSAQCAEAMSVIEATAKELGITLNKSENIDITVKSKSLSGSVFEYKDTEIHLSLAGSYQLENAKTALSALGAVNESGLLKVNLKDIQKGFSSAVNPARLQVIKEAPLMLLDGAHNPNGIEALKTAVREFFGGRKLIGVMGMLADKDIDGAISLLKDVFEKVFVVPVDNPRAISPNELADKFRRYCDDVTVFESVKEALNTAADNALDEDCDVIVFGSLYLASEVLKIV